MMNLLCIEFEWCYFVADPFRFQKADNVAPIWYLDVHKRCRQLSKPIGEREGTGEDSEREPRPHIYMSRLYDVI
jgi:hypothetical protein